MENPSAKQIYETSLLAAGKMEQAISVWNRLVESKIQALESLETIAKCRNILVRQRRIVNFFIEGVAGSQTHFDTIKEMYKEKGVFQKAFARALQEDREYAWRLKQLMGEDITQEEMARAAQAVFTERVKNSVKIVKTLVKYLPKMRTNIDGQIKLLEKLPAEETSKQTQIQLKKMMQKEVQLMEKCVKKVNVGLAEQQSIPKAFISQRVEGDDSGILFIPIILLGVPLISVAVSGISAYAFNIEDKMTNQMVTFGAAVIVLIGITLSAIPFRSLSDAEASAANFSHAVRSL